MNELEIFNAVDSRAPEVEILARKNDNGIEVGHTLIGTVIIQTSRGAKLLEMTPDQARQLAAHLTKHATLADGETGKPLEITIG